MLMRKRLYTNKLCCIINQWNWGWAEQHVSPHLLCAAPPHRPDCTLGLLKLTGRKNLGRKWCTSNRDDCKLDNTVKQSWFNHLWELHKEWIEAGVSASRVTTLRRLQEKGYQASSEPETASEASYLGCGEKELDCCSVVQSPLFRWK